MSPAKEEQRGWYGDSGDEHVSLAVAGGENAPGKGYTRELTEPGHKGGKPS